jgi:hypothetical protein
MVFPVRKIARAAFLGLIVTVGCARAQTTEPSRDVPVNAAQPDSAGGGLPAGAAQHAAPARPQVDTTEIIRRANKDVGVDIQATMAGWQRELDRIEGELRPGGSTQELFDLSLPGCSRRPLARDLDEVAVLRSLDGQPDP